MDKSTHHHHSQLKNGNWYGCDRHLQNAKDHKRTLDDAERLRQRQKQRLQNGDLNNERITVWAVARPILADLSEFDPRLLPASDVLRLYPPNYVAEQVAPRVSGRDLRVLSIGRTSLSFETTVGRLNSLFNARVDVATQPVFYGTDRVVHWPYLRIASSVRLPRQLDEVLLEVGLPCPPTFARAEPPTVSTYAPLNLPRDLAACVHADGTSVHGKGAKVAIIDTGIFLDHKYFRPDKHETSKYKISTFLEADAELDRTDEWGHGTPLAAALLAVAPEVELTMVKLPMENQDIGLRNHVTDALRHLLQKIKPDVVVCAWGFSENHPDQPVDLATEIKAAIANDRVVFVCAAGNLGKHLFPANLTDVIAVGGAHRGPFSVFASNYTSSFSSQVTQKHCPDIAGPSGDASLGIYIMAPTGRVSYFDVFQYHEGQRHPDGDETQPGDGWCGIGGSSVAAAVVGGVAALVRSADPGLEPSEVKDILMATADKVTGGESADREVPPNATGAGFVNAQGAVTEALLRKTRRPKPGLYIDRNKPFGLPVRK